MRTIYAKIPRSHPGSNAALLGFRALTYSLQSKHPPVLKYVALLGIFTENMLPVVCIFHMPTTTRIYWDAIASLDSLDKNTEALLFAVYYSAISMKSRQCINTMDISREAAIEKYRFAVEQAMARANLLNLQSITLLQAAVVSLSVLLNEDDSCTAWSLTSFICHKQKLWTFTVTATFWPEPFETELRHDFTHMLSRPNIVQISWW